VSRCASRQGRSRRGARRPRTVHAADAPAVSVERLCVDLEGRPALTDVTFQVATGRQLAVVGPNGAGKTTLLRVLAGLLRPTSGAVRIHGHGPSRHICISYVPQRSGIDWRFPVSVSDVVMMGRIRRIGPLRRPGANDHRIVREALAAVDLDDLALRQIEQLSGGQQQRMFLARALAQEADVILLDEPLAGLDAPSRSEVLSLIARLRERAVTVLVALHDLGTAASSFDEVLLLKGQKIGIGRASEVFTEANLREAYGTCLHLADAGGGAIAIQDTACSGGEDGHR